ncbi:16059_t:CDS:2, partial [Funneliformis geosporum]
EEYYLSLAIEILGGLREKIIPSTPEDYVSIYTDCWDNEPDNHPSMNQVVDELYAIKTESDEYDNESDKSHSELDNENNSNELNYFDLDNGAIYGAIVNKKSRENSIPHTPKDYEILYQKCWEQEPKDRPSIIEVLEEISIMNFEDKSVKDQITKELCLVMEYADGSNLQCYLKNKFKVLSWNNKKNLAFQIADGLNYLHNENVLHRDLHSKNIVIHNDNAKITDFGISKIENNPTRHLGPCGSSAYMEPQILKDHKFIYIKASDIYSYGVLMWEISSGYSPFKGLDNLAIQFAIAFHEDHFAETSNNSNPNSGSQIDNAQIDTYKDLSVPYN